MNPRDLDPAAALLALDARLKLLLPEQYQSSYDDVQPVSMGSAGLKFAADGTVAWDQMWGSFCDLAMAGGPPHKGTLLEPGSREAVDAAFARYDEVAEEICRGIRLVTGLRAYASPTVGWVRVTCYDDTMAGWLMRAIVMENVSARRGGAMLDLPAAPHFRLEKEIKNVITVIAKTCHYWMGHIPAPQRQAIGDLLRGMAIDEPLIEPERAVTGQEPALEEAATTMAELVERQTGLRRSTHRYATWMGMECPSVRSAVWMMRALVVGNILARREGTTLFVPVTVSPEDGVRVAGEVTRVFRLAGPPPSPDSRL